MTRFYDYKTALCVRFVVGLNDLSSNIIPMTVLAKLQVAGYDINERMS